MGNLENKRIRDSYGGLLHTTEDTGLSGTTKSVIQDGNGVDTALELSTDKVDVNGDLQTGGVDRLSSTGELTNVSGLISLFTNDAGYLSSVPPTYLQTGDNVSELTNDSGYLTSGTLPSNIMREGENVSLLNNDAGYISSIPATYLESGDNVSELTNDAGYLTNIPSDVMREGENISLLNNDSGYLTDGTLPSNVMREGENISLLNNDSGFITGVNDGVIQTENGGSLGTGKTYYTDSQGNKTGQYTWKAFGLNGVSNTDNTGQSPQWLVSNDNWDVNIQFPQASGNITFGFTDYDQFLTYLIQQNRFGSITYQTQAPNQKHIFNNGNGTAVINMNSFGSSNNSDNWFEGYQRSITNVSVDLNNNLVLDKQDGSTLSTPLPAGGSSDPSLYNTTESIASVGSQVFWKLNIPTTSYSASGFGIGVDRLTMNQILDLPEGSTIKDCAIRITSAQAGATLTLGLYSLQSGTSGLYPATLETTLGTIDASTTGLKQITGVNYTIPTSNYNAMYVGILQTGGSGSVSILGPSNTATLTMFSALDGTIHNRAMSAHKNSITSLPTSLSEADWSGYTHNTACAFFGTK